MPLPSRSIGTPSAARKLAGCRAAHRPARLPARVEHVGHVDHRAGGDGARGHRVTAGPHREMRGDALQVGIGNADAAAHADPLAVEGEDEAVFGATEPHRALGDGLEHRLRCWSASARWRAGSRLVAVCFSSASCVSLNRRTFSIAITAWRRRSGGARRPTSGNSPGSRRATPMVPIEPALVQQRHRHDAEKADSLRAVGAVGSVGRGRRRTSATWIGACSMQRAPMFGGACSSGMGNIPLLIPSASTVMPSTPGQMHDAVDSRVVAPTSALQSTRAPLRDRLEHRAHVGRRAG